MILYNPSISGSLVVTGSNISLNGVNVLLSNETSSISVLSSSFASTASYVLNGISSSFSSNALTSSNAMTASSADTLYVRNNVTALGSITAQTLIVQTVTSSVLFTTGSNKIGSSLSNTQELTGSVGITGSFAVTTTGTELQVNAGGVNIGNALTDNHIISGSLRVNPNGLFVSSSGNVGIGTTTISVSTNYIALNINGTTGSEIYLKGNNVDYGYIYANSGAVVLATQTAIPLNFQTNATTRLSITSGGDLNLASGVAILNRNGKKIELNPNSALSDTTAEIEITSGMDLFFKLGGAERMRITSAGNVQVKSAGKLIVYRSDNSRYGEFYNDNLAVHLTSSNDPLRISSADRTEFYNSGSERMRITSGGDVYIGKTSTSSTVVGMNLYSNGQIYNTSSNTHAQLITRTNSDGKILIFYKDSTEVGSISTNTYALPSDLNFKKNINNLTLGLNLIGKLRPVSYNHKIDDEGSALSTGFIAQELEQSLTEIGVNKNEYYILQNTPNEDESQSQYWLDYTKLIPVLAKAIQELKAENDSLKEILLRNNIV